MYLEISRSVEALVALVGSEREFFLHCGMRPNWTSVDSGFEFAIRNYPGLDNHVPRIVPCNRHAERESVECLDLQ